MLGLKLLESLYGLLMCDQFRFFAVQSQIAFRSIALDGLGLLEQCLAEPFRAAQLLHGDDAQAGLFAQSIQLVDAILNLL